MRKLIVAEHISLDGIIQSPGAPKEDPSNGFKLGGWTVPFSAEEVGPYLNDMFGQPFALLLGRNTYDIWAGYWPHVSKDSEVNSIAEKFNSTAKHVATHKPETLKWNNSHALKGDIADAVRSLKQQKGVNLLTWGSGHMVNQLLAAGLIDEFWFLIYPVVIGEGKRLFDSRTLPTSFALKYSTITPTGVILTRYERAGEVKTGSYQ